MHTCNRCKRIIAADETFRLYNKPFPGTPYHSPSCPNGARPESKAAEPVQPRVIATPAEPVIVTGSATDEGRVREIATEVLTDSIDKVVVAVADSVKQNAMTMEQAQAMVDEAIAKRAVRITITEVGKPDVNIDSAHYNMPWAVSEAERGGNLYLYGEPGSGKSYAAWQYSQARGRRFGFMAVTNMSMPYLLYGAPTIHGTVTRTDFRECYEHGGVFAMDEMDNGSPNFLAGLNAAIAGNSAAFPDAIIPKHPNFSLWGSGNTLGRGGDPAYPEREGMDTATIDRLSYVPWPIDPDLERRVALAHNPGFAAWITWIQTVRAWAKAADPKLVISPRATYGMAQGFKQGTLSRDQILLSNLWKGIEDHRVARLLAAHPYPKA